MKIDSSLFLLTLNLFLLSKINVAQSHIEIQGRSFGFSAIEGTDISELNHESTTIQQFKYGLNHTYTTKKNKIFGIFSDLDYEFTRTTANDETDTTKIYSVNFSDARETRIGLGFGKEYQLFDSPVSVRLLNKLLYGFRRYQSSGTRNYSRFGNSTYTIFRSNYAKTPNTNTITYQLNPAIFINKNWFSFGVAYALNLEYRHVNDNRYNSEERLDFNTNLGSLKQFSESETHELSHGLTLNQHLDIILRFRLNLSKEE